MAATGDGGAAPAGRRWDQEFARRLAERFGGEAAGLLAERYEHAFDPAYRGRYGPADAVRDIELIEALERLQVSVDAGADADASTGADAGSGAGADAGSSAGVGAGAAGGGPWRGPLAMDLRRSAGADLRTFRFQLFHPGGPVHLSDSLPMLENMGLRVEDEHPRELRRAGVDRCDVVWLHDFGLRERSGREVDLAAVGEAFKECFARVWSGEAEDDGFNRLALAAGLGWREIALLRAYAKYLRQVRFGLSQPYIEDTLARNPALTRELVHLFHARFDPERAGGAGGDGDGGGDPAYAVAERVLAGLETVASLDEDRILRTCFELIEGTLRTNFYQRGPDGAPRPCLALKLDPACVHETPEPRPRFEVFVYSPRLEGVHLRGGPIARGGIRWSDRREDFRTEVLGLLKTQMVKNAVIVPVGSKGGFVLKRPPDAGGGRAALAAEGLACYRQFIGALLEVTDNYAGGEVVPPPRTVRLDGDDPYLVVAADKGTATFSDTANELACAAGFWLGDAFASGGSDGYDHKGIGITARGAWESVKSHFRVLGRDPEAAPFTVAGIGDMSGDVFGNGMLRSRRIRLVAAFSHLHVFIDPDPDPEASFAERERLFALPGSTWADYREDLVSRGGGVWPRTAKRIPLSPEARAALGIAGGADERAPNDVVRAILRAPVDLLWNGGIGTYVKSSHETHSMVGDRSNDPVRVNAQELRCRMAVEGGNLGFTQAARVEYARAGGLVNTDAIDNSGGVDCSDHEVNIKVLLDDAVRGGALGPAERSPLLHAMTDEVARQVLRNNYLQNVALAVARSQAPALLEVHARLIERLERTRELDRAGEGLPDRDEIAERRKAGEGLVGPELAVLMAFAKLDLFEALIGSELPEDPEMAGVLAAYFPEPVRERFAGRIPRHRLAREIVATVAANETVNRCGISFAFQIVDEIGAAPEDVVRACFAVRNLYGLPQLFDTVERADLPAGAHAAAVLEVRKLLGRAARWLLRNAPRPLSAAAVVERYREGVRAVAALMPAAMSETVRGETRAAAAALAEAGVPAPLAERLALCSQLPAALDATEVALRLAGGTAAGEVVEQAVQAWYGVDELLGIGWLQARVAALPRDDRWQALARGALRGDLLRRHRALAAQVLAAGGGSRPDAALRAWGNANARAIRRWTELLADLRAELRVEYPMVAVALRELREVGSAGDSGGGGLRR